MTGAYVQTDRGREREREGVVEGRNRILKGGRRKTEIVVDVR